jgi:hypothetical protein
MGELGDCRLARRERRRDTNMKVDRKIQHLESG